jgi:RimJ/RimL family protein N-acetyltransferase
MIRRTHRMRLSLLSAHDLEDLYALDQDAEVRRYIDAGQPPEPWETYRATNLQKLQSATASGPDLGLWTARHEHNSFIGWFHLRPNANVFPGEMEIGYRLHRKFWGLGLATEGTRHLLDTAFAELNVTYVMGTTLAANVASRRVMEKAGMRFERSFTYPESLAPFWNDEQRAAVKYSLTFPAKNRTGEASLADTDRRRPAATRRRAFPVSAEGRRDPPPAGFPSPRPGDKRPAGRHAFVRWHRRLSG